MIESFLYLTTSRLDIMQAICIVSGFQTAPKESHVHAVKRILKYIKNTIDYGLWYPKCKDFSLTAYTNANWARSVNDRKNTSGGVFFLGNKLVS